MTTVQRIQNRRGTTAEWTESNPVLGFGEIGVEITTTGATKFKIGNGNLTWSALPYYENTAALNLSQYVTESEAAAILNSYVPVTQKGANNGVATLDSSGKIPASQLPTLAITDTFVVASQSAMLALTAQVGDVAVRTDINKSFILRTSPATTLANWQELLSPPNAVTSVNGKTGTVVLKLDDINDVTIDAGVQSGWYLSYNAATQVWEAKQLPTVDTTNFATTNTQQSITSRKVFNNTGTTNGLHLLNTSLTFEGSGSLILPGNVTPSQTTEGSVVWDTDNDLLTIGTNTGRKTFVDTDTVQTLTSKTLNEATLRGLKEPINIITSTPTNLTAQISQNPINLFSLASTSTVICAVTMQYSSGSTSFTDANLPVGSSMTATVIINNTGSSASYINAVSATGLTTTTRWLNGVTPTSGNIGSYDVYNFVLIKTGSTTGLILATQTKF